MTELASDVIYGGKSAGLHSLKADWTLPFVTVNDDLHQAWVGSDGKTRLRDLVSMDLKNSLADELSSFGDSPEDVALWVRSDAMEENLSARGQLSSHRSDATIDGVLDAAEQIFRQGSSSQQRIGLILQRSVSAQKADIFPMN